ncbi:MAG: hypothetical protein AAF264_02195 [Pseudomonadota bacterium]
MVDDRDDGRRDLGENFGIREAEDEAVEDDGRVRRDVFEAAQGLGRVVRARIGIGVGEFQVFDSVARRAESRMRQRPEA